MHLLEHRLVEPFDVVEEAAGRRQHTALGKGAEREGVAEKMRLEARRNEAVEGSEGRLRSTAHTKGRAEPLWACWLVA